MRQPIQYKGNPGMMLLPAKEGTCELCATKHEPELPHNQKSLFWHSRFFAENERWPTWLDAMAHCSEKVQEKWKMALKEMGEKIGDEPAEEKKHASATTETVPSNKKKAGRRVQQKQKTGRVSKVR